MFYRRAFDHFFNKGTTLAKIKDAALGDKLFPSPIPSNGCIGIAGRSIAWKVRSFTLLIYQKCNFFFFADIPFGTWAFRVVTGTRRCVSGGYAKNEGSIQELVNGEDESTRWKLWYRCGLARYDGTWDIFAHFYSIRFPSKCQGTETFNFEFGVQQPVEFA